MVLKRVGVVSMGKFMAGAYGMIGLIMGLFTSMITLIVGSGNGQMAALGGLGLLAALIYPIVFAVMGFIGGLLGGLIFNLVAGFTGGIEMDFQ